MNASFGTGSSFSLLLLYLQIVNLYRDPNGEKIFDKNNSDDTFETGNISTISSGNMNAGPELAKLQNKIREHEESIRVKDRKISELEKLMVPVRYNCIWYSTKFVL